jgi:hypothetical protein
MSEIKPKKMVSRNVAIALGIICVMLIAILGAVIFFTDTSWQNRFNDLNSSYNNYMSTHSHTNYGYDSLQSQFNNLSNSFNGLNATYYQLSMNASSLQNQVNSLNNSLNLNESLLLWNYTIYNPPKTVQEYYSWPQDYSWPNYAGYVSVQVISDNNSTYVEVGWEAYGINYDSQVLVGTNGTAIFPILPLWGNPLVIYIGNTDAPNGAHITFTALYFY